MVSLINTESILSDRYRLVEELGAGDFGRTYLAEDLRNPQQKRVIREYNPQVSGSQVYAKEKLAELFQKEAAILSPLDHPQIPKLDEFLILESGDRQRILLVQEYIEGMPLANFVKTGWNKGRKYTEEEVLEFLRQVLPILDYIHSLGAIHRDLCPQNILLRQEDDLPFLIDFGGFKQAILNIEAEGNQKSSLWLGRPGYAPEEQRDKGIIFTYSDLYALGATVLTLMTGKEPQQLKHPKTGEWQWQKHLRLSPKLNAILSKMLAKWPGDRYQSAAEILVMINSQPKSNPVGKKRPQEAKPTPETKEVKEATPPKAKLNLRSAIRQGLVNIVKLIFLTTFLAGAGVGGWFAGTTWLQTQIKSSPFPSSTTDSNIDLSPRIPEPEGDSKSPETLNFPPTDDPEAEPDPSLPPSERDRKLALKERRLKLAIDYRFYRALVDSLFASQYPEKAGKILGNGSEDRQWRDRWDAVAARVLDRLAPLEAEARRGLGHYRLVDRERWLRDARQLDVSEEAFTALVDGAFFENFPEQRKKDFLEEPIGQVWYAIALSRAAALQSGAALETIIFNKGEPILQKQGALEPGQGKIWTTHLNQGQKIALNVIADSSISFSLYGPNGKTILENAKEPKWSGNIPESGLYELVLVSQSVGPLNYQVSLEIKN